VSAPRKLETLGDVLRRDYKRRWRKANPDKVREHRVACVARQVVSNFVAKQGELL